MDLKEKFVFLHHKLLVCSERVMLFYSLFQCWFCYLLTKNLFYPKKKTNVDFVAVVAVLFLINFLLLFSFQDCLANITPGLTAMFFYKKRQCCRCVHVCMYVCVCVARQRPDCNETITKYIVSSCRRPHLKETIKSTTITKTFVENPKALLNLVCLGFYYFPTPFPSVIVELV